MNFGANLALNAFDLSKSVWSFFYTDSPILGHQSCVFANYNISPGVGNRMPGKFAVMHTRLADGGEQSPTGWQAVVGSLGAVEPALNCDLKRPASIRWRC